MIICENEKNIESLLREFGDSTDENTIRSWYYTKQDYLNKNGSLLPYTTQVVTYFAVKHDLDLAFPDNVPKEKNTNSNKKYKTLVELSYS